jgi:hypothetical protein
MPLKITEYIACIPDRKKKFVGFNASEEMVQKYK